VKNCKAFENSPADLKNCIENSNLCKYCSDQYSGYPDCLHSYSDCTYHPQKYGLQEASECLLYFYSNKEFSSSFLFQNPNSQMCENPYEQIYPGDSSTCLDIFPETAKCSASSKCPDCPCGAVDKTVSENKISENRVCTADCVSNNYNGDNLTFYCQASDMSEEQKSAELQYENAKQFTCSKAYEIPVGQAVDDAKDWADKLIQNIGDFVKKTQNMIEYIKKAGNAQNYCKCNSKFDSGDPICKTDCQYNPPVTTTTVDPDTNSETTTTADPFCSFVPCQGNPCSQIIFYLQVVVDYYPPIKKSFEDFYTFTLTSQTTDTVKELVYSRNSMNSCSVYAKQQNTSYLYTSVPAEFRRFTTGPIKTLDCTRAYLNGFVQDRCYGIIGGTVASPPQDLTDNWFCCEQVNR